MRDRWRLAPPRRLILLGAIVAVGSAALFAVSLPGTDLLRRTHADQSPADCASHDFVLTLQQSLTYFGDTATVHYTVLAGNPNSSGAGCDVSEVDVSLTTPDGVVHALGSGLGFPIGTAVSPVGGASYVPSASAPEFNGAFGYDGAAWVAVAEASGRSLNNPAQDEPWQLRKTVSVEPVSIVVSARSSPPGEASPGAAVTVTFVLLNDGVGSLEDPRVTSPQCDPAAAPSAGSNQGDLNGNGVLDPGESWIFICEFVVSESIDVTGAGSGRLAGSEREIVRPDDPDATATVRIHVAAIGDPPADDAPVDEPSDDAAPADPPPDAAAPDDGADDGGPGDGAPAVDDGSPGDAAADAEATSDDPPSSRPSGLPDAGSGGLLGMSGAEPVAYGAIVMGLLTLGFAVFLRRVAGRGGTRRG